MPDTNDRNPAVSPLPLPDPDLQQRLRDLADARVREQIAAAAIARQAAADARTAQGQRRRYGVDRRNAAREARLRLTQKHNQPEEKPEMSDTIRFGRITDPTGQHVFFYAVHATEWDRFRACYDRDEVLSIEPFGFTDPQITAATEAWVDAATQDEAKPAVVMVGSIENRRWVNWNLADVSPPPVAACA